MSKTATAFLYGMSYDREHFSNTVDSLSIAPAQDNYVYIHVMSHYLTVGACISHTDPLSIAPAQTMVMSLTNTTKSDIRTCIFRRS